MQYNKEEEKYIEKTNDEREQTNDKREQKWEQNGELLHAKMGTVTSSPP